MRTRAVLVAILIVIAGFAGAASVAHAQPPPAVIQVAGGNHILVLFADGTVIGLGGYGGNRAGQIGPGPTDRRFYRARRIELPGKAVQIAASSDTSYAVLEDGTVAAWGRGSSRELGLPLTDGTFRATALRVPGLTGVKQIAAGDGFAYAVLADGTVRAWGAVSKELAGPLYAYPGVALPFPVRGLTGIAHVLAQGFALTNDGHVMTWGGNQRGTRGIGTVTPDVLPPTEIPGLKDVVSIASTGWTTAAVTRDGRVWTWGDNEQAGIGDGTHADTMAAPIPAPQPVTAVANAVAVKSGTAGRHTIVLRKDGTLIGWGNSDWGQLGAGISGNFQPRPMAIKLASVDDFWLDGNYSFARTKDGQLWFWGESDGALPLLGTSANQRVPVVVPRDRITPTAAATPESTPASPPAPTTAPTLPRR